MTFLITDAPTKPEMKTGTLEEYYMHNNCPLLLSGNTWY